MTSPPDKLFKDGLGNFQKPAPPNAWDRVAFNLDLRKPQLPWLKIAAGIIIVLGVTYLFWPNEIQHSEIASTQESSKEHVTLKDFASTNFETPILKQENQEAIESQRIAQSTKEMPVQKTQPQKKSSIIAMVQAGNMDKYQESVVTPLAQEVVIAHAESIPVAEATIASSDPVLQEEVTRTHISYSAEEVNARFLKQDLPAEATSEKKSTSSLKKVIDLAFHHNNDESVFGELRDKKNELLRIDYSTKDLASNK